MPLLEPFCGSATIPDRGRLHIATRRAPGLRSHFAFESCSDSMLELGDILGQAREAVDIAPVSITRARPFDRVIADRGSVQCKGLAGLANSISASAR